MRKHQNPAQAARASGSMAPAILDHPPGGALARLADQNVQAAAKRILHLPANFLHAVRTAKVARPATAQAPGPVAAGPPADLTELGRHQSTDEGCLVCVAGATKEDFIPTQSDLLVSLVKAGINKTMCQLGGSHLRECIAIRPGASCRTWRLVLASPEAKESFMRLCFIHEAALNGEGLVISDWA